MTFNLKTDRTRVRAAARSTRYLHVSFEAPVAEQRPDRRPMSVAFVLDRSGSMAGEKLQLARAAVDASLRMLSPDDIFSIVVYDQEVDVLVPATRATNDARRMASRALDEVQARGRTDLCAGWLSGCEQVADRADVETIARCFLLSDGLANDGITDQAVLASRADQLRRAHVMTSTFGVGADFDERLMASMARAGGGQFYYIQHARQTTDLLTSALGEALDIVARRAVVELELPMGVEAEVLHDFRSTVSGQRMRIELEDLVSGQDVSLIVKLHFPTGEDGDTVSLRASVSSADGVLSGAARAEWIYADHAANDAQPRARDVDRLVAEVYAARARREAVEFNRAGNLAAAVSVLRRTQQRIQSYAGSDAEMCRAAESLHLEEDMFSTPMDKRALKAAHFGISSAMRMREASGRARRQGS